MKSLVKILDWLGENFFDILKVLAALVIALIIIRDDSRTSSLAVNLNKKNQMHYHIDANPHGIKQSEITTPYGYGEDKPQKITWSNLQGGDEGTAIKIANWPKKSVSVTGVWADISAKILGSNDGVNYFDLSDEQGESLFFTNDSLKTIGPNTLYIKPKVFGKTSGNLRVDLVVSK